tara:strand:- start:846 stop:1034 length:189 start_codon:yes stop_codon:yes gene_type:complete
MRKKLNIQSVKYMEMDGVKVGVKMVLVGNPNPFHVPLDLANTDYEEIKRQVDANELTIEDAD